jgi:hypothetical protein
MDTIVGTAERVRKTTSARTNQEIDEEIINNIESYRLKGGVGIASRIKQLDKEWDIERTLEINAAIAALTGTLLAAFVNRKWLVLPAIVTTFLAQHAIQGWCPPLPLFRKLGIRSRPEIDREKYALKALRGDFNNIHSTNDAWRAVNA